MARYVLINLWFLLLGINQVFSFELDIKEKGKISIGCRGESVGLGASGTPYDRYMSYKRRYTNCTYVDGNLEIKFLEGNTSYDLSFLENIEEVNGYVLITSVYATYVPLINLRIIRGKELFFHNNDSYSLFVALNMMPGSQSIGLKELRFKHLTEISRGNVYFHNNELLCHHSSIHWADIISEEAKVIMVSNSTQNLSHTCGECSPSCLNDYTGQRHCWGSGPAWCQKLTKVVCHKGCDSRCFGTNARDCCHSQCAAGCTGPRSSDCVKCKNFYNEGTCVSDCPKLIIYDTHTLESKPNPDGRYKYRTFCVKSCPEHLLTEPKLEACVRTCRQGYYPVNSTCKECDGPCPKTCKAAEFSNNGLDIVSNISIDLYKNCTIIEGNLKIVEATFNGDPHLKIPGLTIDQLDVFKTVKEITGYLMVQSNVENLTSLSFLSNLTVIHGRELDSAGSAFSVMNTHFKSLEMISLKRIENGRIILYKNKNLCYIQDNNFLSLYPESKKRSDLVMLRSNKPADRCRAEGEVCDLSCSDDGCWGKGPNKCLSCRTYKIDNSSNICIDSCSRVPRLYDSGNRLCKFCDEECLSGCTGAGPEKCDKCKHFELRGSVNGTEIVRCLAECPPYYYPDQNNVCHKCHPFCDEGCTGPSYEVKRGGCNTCALAIEIISPNGILITSCQDPDTEKCDHGYFRSTKPHLNLNSTRRMPVCVQCHPMCDGCYEAGASQCMECRHVKQDELCAEKCVSYAYPDDDNICQPCNAQCSGGCFGPTSADCNACLNKKIYLDKPDPDSGLLPIPEHCINSTEVCRRDFNCTKECPPNLQYLVQDMEAKEEAKTVCADENYKAVRAMLQNNEDAKKKQLMYIIFGTIGGVLLLGFILLVFGYFWKQRAKSQEKTAILTAKMTGYGEDEPVTPTDAKPDMSSLRLIKESELRRGGIIGSGAFGTVYKGFWIPSNEHVKIPVAIKVLQEGTSPNQNKELLEEARVMASVEHPCCIRILAVCMTAQMMLITQLMPLGCLLDYVRKHKDNIGSKVLLNWCTQIAKGMAYLEERGIVHRDLAARNVLVQSPGQIKITDFGLAKLLDYNEDEYHASGGKMPIKWLALECIQHRIFTHKSDVWSYGVTVWELLTYGQRPYENVRARDVPDLLEKGERLSQPPVCTIDVYMIMIKCWMLDADSRPKFTELAEEFAKMARDPGRYLVIAGDVLKKIPDDSNTPSRIELITPDTSENPTMQSEGDKLMRLPSHSYDKNDLARSLSVAADSPEEVMEAEEYLQPTPRHSMEPPTTPVSSKTPLLPSIQPYGEAAHAREVKDHARPQPRREKRYGHLESAAAARQQRLDPGRMRGDSINSRYSSDPVKVIHFDEADGNPFRNGSVGAADRLKNYPSVAKKDYKQLALDEDNYLQPSSTKPQAYTDIIDGPDYLNDSSVFIESPNQQYVQHDPQALNFQNPEYFDDVSASPQNVPNKNFFNSPHSNNNGFHSNSNRSKDYYNDLAMKKSPELKPLIISEDNSETTV